MKTLLASAMHLSNTLLGSNNSATSSFELKTLATTPAVTQEDGRREVVHVPIAAWENLWQFIAALEERTRLAEKEAELARSPLLRLDTTIR